MKERANIRTEKKINVLAILTLAVLILYVISLCIPLVWAFVTAFKSNLDYLENPLWLPQKWFFKNILTAVNNFTVTVNKKGSMAPVYIEEMLLNSLLYALGGAFISTFTCTVTAYATARFDFKLSKVIYAIVIITMTLPIVGNLPSELQLLKSLGFYDHIWGLWICKANFLGLYYLVFHALFKTMRKDFTEAAYMDGASNFRVLFSIAMPLVRGTFMTVMLIKFIELWNDYTVTLTYMPTHPTLAYGLYAYSFSASQEISNTPMRLAGCIVLIIPILLVFVAFHKRLLGNISMGGIKE